MAHSTNATTNIISSIKLPNGNTYEIHDASALHNIEDLGLAGVLQFVGVVPLKSQLPTTGNRVGDVYHVTADDYEYVWVEKTAGKGEWEEFGAAHDFISTAVFNAHTHVVEGSGTVVQKTANGKATGIPVIQANVGTATGTAQAQELNTQTDIVLGADTGFHTSITGNGLGTVTKKGLKATAKDGAVEITQTTSAVTGVTSTTRQIVSQVTTGTASVVGSITPTTGTVVTGITPTTGTKAIATLNTTAVVDEVTASTAQYRVVASATDTTIKQISTNTTINIPNVNATDVTIVHVTENTTKVATHINSFGTQAAWNATVTAGGVLEFSWTANEIAKGSDVTATYTSTTTGVVSKVTFGTVLQASKITEGTVVLSKVSTSTVTLVTSVTSSTTTVATGAKTHVTPITSVTATTGEFVNGVTPTPETVIKTVTPTTGEALATVTANKKADVATAIGVSAQPTITISAVTAGSGNVNVVTEVASGTLEANTTADAVDRVTVVTGVTASSSPVTVTAVTSVTVTTRDAEVSVTVPSQTVTISGTAKALK